jgi:alkanesulfonate monooxygenase SsuD/methylene tetrahydromethanopterin reductase-like flavin-dependent oxidoreductase (luciferase family)
VAIDHSERYAIAHEFADVVTRLWGSWEADAVVEDRDAGVFVDHTKVHSVDFEGKYFRSRGPLNVPQPPQGRPVIAQAGGSPAGRSFAAKWADTIIGYCNTPSQMKEYRDDIRARMLDHGRKPDDCKVMFLIGPIIGATDEEARQRQQAQRDLTIAGR